MVFIFITLFTYIDGNKSKHKHDLLALDVSLFYRKVVQMSGVTSIQRKTSVSQ